MANFDQLKQSVAALIRTNGAEEITGQIMQDVLLTIINSISGGYMFGGVAQHSGNVGNPDYNVFYLAGSGAYTGYGDAINIPDGCYGVFRYNGSWTQDVVDIGVHLTGTIREGETNGVTGDVINTALQQLFNNIMNILDTLTFMYNTPSGQQATKAMLDVIVTPTGGASHVLTTLTLVSATAAAAGLMSAEDKRKVDRMLTDFRSLSFSDTTAVADQATKIVQTLSATLGENPEAITTMTFLAATVSKAGLLSAADKAKLDALWSSGYQFVGIATPSTTPISTTSKIFYIATEAGIYFNAVTVTQGINIIYKSGDAWSVAQVVGIDNEPTAGSDRLVKSGGVFGELALGAVYDVSAKNPTAGPNSDGKWESLSALLSDANLNTLIPTSVRKGGMSIKYVQSSDNKYVQYRLMSDTFNTDVTQWRGVEDDLLKVYSPIFGTDKTFALNNAYASALLRLSILECCFDYPAPNRIGIYSCQISNNKIVIVFSNCDTISDDTVITSDNSFGFVLYDVSNINTGQIKAIIYAENNNITPIGYVIIDVGLFKEAGTYVRSSTPTTFNNSGFYSVKTDKIQQDIRSINLSLAPVISLGWNVQLIGESTSTLTPKQLISLSQNGDSIEISFDDISVEDFENGGYAFVKTVDSQTSVRGIFVAKSSLRVRFNDGTWLSSAVDFTPKSTFKIEYTGGNVILSVDGTQVATYTGQKLLTICDFGNGVNSQYTTYWSGIIKSIKVNGQALSLTDDFVLGQSAKVWRAAGFLTDEQDSKLESAVNHESLYAMKSQTALYIYHHLYNDTYIQYPLNYRHEAYAEGTYPSYYDNWGIGRPSLAQFRDGKMYTINYLFHTSEAELAINLARADGQGDAYVGGAAHGFENIVNDNGRKIVILVDNKLVAENATFSLKPIVSVLVTQETELVQAYSNSNPFARATKQWFFDANGLEITTSLKVLRSIQFVQAQFGMLGVYRHYNGDSSKPYLTNAAIKGNNPYKVYDVSDGWESETANNPLKTLDKDCTKITIYGQYPYGFALSVKNTTVKANGGMKVGTNTSVYNKIYFDMTGNYTPQVDEELHATQKWEIQ